MTRTVIELVAILSLSVASSVVATFVTAIMLSAARADLAAIHYHQIGNGRLASAKGEHRLAWARFIEAGVSVLLTSLLIFAGVSSGLDNVVGPVWTIIVVSVFLIDALVCFKAVVSARTRSRIYDMARHNDLGDMPPR